MAVAGPLTGLVFAIPALLIGLRFSQVIPGNGDSGLGQVGVDIGSSVLLAFLANLSLGASVLEGNHLLLHPLAFAGWLGLIVTALNLLPIGQLDGGHISHALFGTRAARHQHGSDGLVVSAGVVRVARADVLGIHRIFHCRHAGCAGRQRSDAGGTSPDGAWLFHIFGAAAHHRARPAFALSGY